MSDMSKNIAVYLYDIYNRNVGLGEFEWQIGNELAHRADALRKQYGLVFTFIVPHKFIGCFGNDVKYMPFFPLTRLWVRHSLRRFDLCHLTHQRTKLKYMKRASMHLTTVHDINFIYEKIGLSLKKHHHKFARNISYADALSYISHFVKNDVETHFAPKCDGDVIYNGVTDLTGLHGDIRHLGIKEDGYLFHISSLMPKKNVHRIVEMMRYLPNERLVVVGNLESHYVKTISDNIAKWGLSNVTMINYVSLEDKAELFRRCKALVFPSLCEGFGLPPVEAMHFGKPVFLSRLTSLPEIGGENAFYFDDLTPNAMAEVVDDKLKCFYSDSVANAAAMRERAKMFSWSSCVDGYVKLYLKLLNLN